MATAQVVTTGWIELGEDVLRWDINWLCTDLGVVSQELSGADLGKVLGWYIFMAKVDPGSTTPTAAWDWTLKDADGIDIMAGLGTDMSATASVMLFPKPDGTNFRDSLVDGPLTFAITAAGDAKIGVNSFFFRRWERK